MNIPRSQSSASSYGSTQAPRVGAADALAGEWRLPGSLAWRRPWRLESIAGACPLEPLRAPCHVAAARSQTVTWRALGRACRLTLWHLEYRGARLERLCVAHNGERRPLPAPGFRTRIAAHANP